MCCRLIRRVVSCILFASVALVLLTACQGAFSAERQYISTIFDHTRRTLDTLNQLQTLAGQPQLSDPAWQSEAATQVERLRGLIDEAHQINVPPSFIDFHRSYLAAIDRLGPIVTTYDQASELQNNQMLQQAQQQLEQSRATIEDLRQRVQSLNTSQ